MRALVLFTFNTSEQTAQPRCIECVARNESPAGVAALTAEGAGLVAFPDSDVMSVSARPKAVFTTERQGCQLTARIGL